jgi:hypothetical protein
MLAREHDSQEGISESLLERGGPDACPGPFRERSNDRFMGMLADSGAVALEAIIVASIVVPAVILVGVCWVFCRAKKREDEAARPGAQRLVDNNDTLAACAGGRHQLVVADEDTQVRAALETLRDPAVNAQNRSRLRRGRARPAQAQARRPTLGRITAPQPCRG